MTDKDRADLAAALEENIDWIALSFVQRPEDVVEVKEIAKGRALVMAKIEKPQAVQRIEEIMAVADALMVARGDLGVEMPLEQVPGIQKTLTRLARRLGKPVVVATQMLESMITSPVPTRAEVSDVATAVFEGADAVMLSAESASGQYPREAVATMNRIAEAVESEKIYPSIIEAQRAAPEATGADAIAEATRDVAETLDLKVICAWTSSGSTGLRIARQRPRSSILALTPIESVARRLAVVWGVHPIVTDDARDERDMADRACRHAYIEGFAGEGERIIVVAGVPFGTPGATNNLRIATVEAEGRFSGRGRRLPEPDAGQDRGPDDQAIDRQGDAEHDEHEAQRSGQGQHEPAAADRNDEPREARQQRPQQLSGALGSEIERETKAEKSISGADEAKILVPVATISGSAPNRLSHAAGQIAAAIPTDSVIAKAIAPPTMATRNARWFWPAPIFVPTSATSGAPRPNTRGMSRYSSREPVP